MQPQPIFSGLLFLPPGAPPGEGEKEKSKQGKYEMVGQYDAEGFVSVIKFFLALPGWGPRRDPTDKFEFVKTPERKSAMDGEYRGQGTKDKRSVASK